jgi:heme/copper-type cytochrome/quinol oxidase subunit 2
LYREVRPPLEAPTGIAPIMRSCQILCPILTIHVTNSVPPYSPLSAFRQELSVLTTRMRWWILFSYAECFERNLAVKFISSQRRSQEFHLQVFNYVTFEFVNSLKSGIILFGS